MVSFVVTSKTEGEGQERERDGVVQSENRGSSEITLIPLKLCSGG